MSDIIRQAIAETEAYLRRYPSGRFSELALMNLDRLLALQGEKKVQLVSAAANPFSKGTGRADLTFRVGDTYKYQVSDLLTKVPGQIKVQTVTAVTAEKVFYNSGGLVTDLLGNPLERNHLARGVSTRFGSSQFYAVEYSIGKKWTTRYPIIFPKGKTDEIEIDFRVAARESITVPAGTFDCFRIEGSGWILEKGIALTETYWMAPDKVARVIAIDSWRKATKGGGKILKSEREELVAFSRV